MSEIGLNISRAMDVSQYKGLGGFKSRKLSVAPSNLSSFVSSTSVQDIFFDIPSAKFSLINGQQSYLTFDITASAVFAAGQDPLLTLSNGSGNSVIRAMEVIIQNNSCEYTNSYNVFAGIMDDLQDPNRAVNVGSILNGAGASVKTGAVLSSTTGVDGAVVRCCLPIYSGVIGTLQQNMCPAVDGIRVRFSLESTAVALNAETGKTYTNDAYKLSNIALKMEYLDASEIMYKTLLAEANGVFKCHGTGVGNYQTTLSTGASVQSVLVPARYSALKSLITAYRLSANLSSPADNNTVGARIFPKIKTVNFTVDGRNVFPVDIRCGNDDTHFFGGEALEEVSIIMGVANSPQFNCVFNSAQYLDAVGTADTGSFVMGFNAEENQGTQNVVSGMDTNSSNIYCNITQTSASLATTVDSFAMYELITSFDMINGTVSVAK